MKVRWPKQLTVEEMSILKKEWKLVGGAVNEGGFVGGGCPTSRLAGTTAWIDFLEECGDGGYSVAALYERGFDHNLWFRTTHSDLA